MLAIASAGTWAIGYQDECWWSRVAQPTLHTFSEEGKPLRLIEHSVAKDETPNSPFTKTHANTCGGLLGHVTIAPYFPKKGQRITQLQFFTELYRLGSQVE